MQPILKPTVSPDLSLEARNSVAIVVNFCLSPLSLSHQEVLSRFQCFISLFVEFCTPLSFPVGYVAPAWHSLSPLSLSLSLFSLKLFVCLFDCSLSFARTNQNESIIFVAAKKALQPPTLKNQVKASLIVGPRQSEKLFVAAFTLWTGNA